LVDPAQDRRILVVEDEPLSAELVRVLLEDLDCHVTVATDGAAAVERAREEVYSLILMDFFLPFMSGLEAVQIIRSEMNMASGQAPIIALTASDNRADHQACLDVGMNDYLLKPLSRDALSAMLWKWKIIELGDPENITKQLASRSVDGFDPSRIESLRDVMESGDFDAVMVQALSSLDEHLLAIGEEAAPTDAQRRAFHRIVSLSQDLGFVALGRQARLHEEALGSGATLDHAARDAFVVAGREVQARLRTAAVV
jgi:CheY-like chemotaxis protein